MKLRWRFNGGRRMDRSRRTEKKRLRISISTPLRFGMEVKAWPVIREWHRSGRPHMRLQSSKRTQHRHAADCTGRDAPNGTSFSCLTENRKVFLTAFSRVTEKASTKINQKEYSLGRICYSIHCQ